MHLFIKQHNTAAIKNWLRISILEFMVTAPYILSLGKFHLWLAVVTEMWFLSFNELFMSSCNKFQPFFLIIRIPFVFIFIRHFSIIRPWLWLTCLNGVGLGTSFLKSWNKIITRKRRYCAQLPHVWISSTLFCSPLHLLIVSWIFLTGVNKY